MPTTSTTIFYLLSYTTPMKGLVTQNKFLESLLEAQRFVAGKGFSSPLLSGIYLEATDANRLIIRASTGSVLFQTEIEGNITEIGSCVIPAGLLVSSVKTLGSGEVQLESDEQQLIITQGDSHFSIASLSGEEFPSLSQEDNLEKLLLPVESFAKAARHVLMAASADETKPVLTAVLLEMRQPNALVATDGFRLSRYSADISLDIDGVVLIPSRTLRDLLGILEKRELATIECLIDSDRASLLFNLGTGWLKTSTIEGDYPNYQAIIPQACAFSLTIDREQLVQAIKQAMIFAKEYSGIVVFETDGQQLLISSQASTSGRTKSRLPIIRTEGEVVRFAVNGRYLLEFLSNLESLEVMIQGNESLKPVLFRVPENDSLLYLVMPFKLQE